MKRKNIFVGSATQGFWAPFAFLFVGIAVIIKTPSKEDLIIFSGVINPDHYFDGILLENEDSKFIFDLKKQKDIASQKLKTATHAKIWVTNNSKERKAIKRLELDEDLILEYNYVEEIRLYLIFIVIGVVLIPVVVKERIKNPNDFRPE